MLIIIVCECVTHDCFCPKIGFQSIYSKSYENETEENKRMAIFLENKSKIAEHNLQFEKGLVSYEMGINKYSDLSADEFRSRMNGFRQSTTLGYGMILICFANLKSEHFFII